MPTKRCTSTRALFAAGLALAAATSFGQPYPRRSLAEPEAALQQARAARYNRDYETSLELAMAVLIEEPENKEARELLREAAAELSRLSVEQVQAERRRVLAEAGKKVEKDQERSAREAGWEGELAGYMKRREFLEAYEWLYRLGQERPGERWPETQIYKLLDRVELNPDFLRLKGEGYQYAFWGFHAFSRSRWDEARALWRSALRAEADDAKFPRALILSYLARLDKMLPKNPAKNAAAPRSADAEPSAVPAPSPRATSEAAKSKALAAKPAPPPNPESESEVEGWYGEAVAAARRGDAASALESLKKVLDHEPGHGPSRELLETVEAKLVREHYVAGLVLYGRGRLDEAVSEWEKALEIKPDDERSRLAAERARKELREISRP